MSAIGDWTRQSACAELTTTGDGYDDSPTARRILAEFRARQQRAQEQRAAERRAETEQLAAYRAAVETLLALPDHGQAAIRQARAELYGPEQAAQGFPEAAKTPGVWTSTRPTSEPPRSPLRGSGDRAADTVPAAARPRRARPVRRPRGSGRPAHPLRPTRPPVHVRVEVRPPQAPRPPGGTVTGRPRSPRNIAIRRADGTVAVRPYHGPRRIP